jgi:hypothetical protein
MSGWVDDVPPAAGQTGAGGGKRDGRQSAGRGSGKKGAAGQQGTAALRPAATGRWAAARPELAVAGIAVTVAALAGAALSGWPGVVTVAVATSVIALLVLRTLIPRSAGQSVRIARDKQVARSIFGYAQRRFVVEASVANRPLYESDLRPVLEHILAARLSESRGINLYTDPAEARSAFCRTRADEALWPWIDPAQALSADERVAHRHGIPSRTLARLIDRLEQL